LILLAIFFSIISIRWYTSPKNGRLRIFPRSNFETKANNSLTSDRYWSATKSTEVKRNLQTSINHWEQMGSNIFGMNEGEESGKALFLCGTGERLAVGSPKNGADAGMVKVYEYTDENAWVQIGQDITGTTRGDMEGISVYMSYHGDRLVTGAYGYDDKYGHGKNVGKVC